MTHLKLHIIVHCLCIMWAQWCPAWEVIHSLGRFEGANEALKPIPRGAFLTTWFVDPEDPARLTDFMRAAPRFADQDIVKEWIGADILMLDAERASPFAERDYRALHNPPKETPLTTQQRTTPEFLNILNDHRCWALGEIRKEYPTKRLFDYFDRQELIGDDTGKATPALLGLNDELSPNKKYPGNARQAGILVQYYRLDGSYRLDKYFAMLENHCRILRRELPGVPICIGLDLSNSKTGEWFDVGILHMQVKVLKRTQMDVVWFFVWGKPKTDPPPEILKFVRESR